MSAYTSTRPRGLAPWNPHRKTRALLDQVEAVLDEYADHLPMTVRQVFYRLVGAFEYAKDDRAYARLCETLVRARRAELISFDAIRDDGVVERRPAGFHDVPGFWRAVQDNARRYRRRRLTGQPVSIEVWAEAGGMVPQLARVAHPYGVTVYSSGGFDSLTVKHDTAERILARTRPTVVLSVGDLDPSGRSIFDAFTEDVGALVQDMGGPPDALEAVRVAVTREQVEKYDLPEKPAKATDRRGDWRGGTVQAEALRPPDLASEVDEAIRSRLDLGTYTALLDTEQTERARLVGATDRLMEGES